VLLGHTQYLNLPIIQIVSFTGVYGVSFIIVLANGAIVDMINCWVGKKGQRRPMTSHLRAYNPFYAGLVVLAIILGLWVGGSRSLSRENTGRPFSVAVVQGNIPQEIKWDRQYREQIISKYENLTEEAAKANPKLIAWPEASTPGFVLKDPSLLRHMVRMIRHFNTHLLVGSAEYPKFTTTSTKPGRSGNTALFFSPQGRVLGQYLKIRLVPFGEYLPYEGIIPWPDFIVPEKRTNFHNSGTELTLFRVNGTQFGTLICWEVLFPDLTRSFIAKGAEFIVNISNEAWFGKSAVPHQVLAMCVFRAIENRVNLIRATNTGVSCFIDPYGRITNRITNKGEDIFVAGILTQEIRLSSPGTFYTRHGDILASGCIAFCLGLVIWVSFKRRLRNSDTL
jgi:apolipoprotein N-acyltransferase